MYDEIKLCIHSSATLSVRILMPKAPYLSMTEKWKKTVPESRSESGLVSESNRMFLILPKLPKFYEHLSTTF